MFKIILLISLAAFPAAAVADSAEVAGREHTAIIDTDAPRRVQFFVWMIDVDAIDSQNQTFTVNMVLRLTWQDEDLAHDGPESITVPLDDIWHPRASLGGIQSRTRAVMDEVAEVSPDGVVVYRQRFVGPISQPLNLSEFPLDTQTFTVHFWATGYGADDVLFEPEQIQDGEDQLVGGTMSSKLSMTDWHVISFIAEPRPLEATNEIQFPGFAFNFTATRHFNYFMWQLITPLVLIVVMSWLPFWVNPSDAGTQFSIASTTVLTLIAYRFVAAGYVPRLPYMTRLDSFTLACTALVFVVLLQVLITSRLAEADHTWSAIIIDKCCRLIFPLLFTAIAIRYWIL
jgi:neurotransmitter-gated ion-channel